MANGPNGLVGGHHPTSRSAQARAVLRDVLEDFASEDGVDDNPISVGLMEFDIGWTTSTSNATRYAVNTCGDLNSRIIDENGNFVYPEGLGPEPLLEGCATEDPTNGFTLDAFGRIIADNNTSRFFSAALPNDTGIGRLRVAVQPLNQEHLSRLNNVLATEPTMPEIRCNRTNAQTAPNQQQCNPNNGVVANNGDYTQGNFLPNVPPNVDNESLRSETRSFEQYYRFNNRLFSIDQTTGIPDLYLDPEAPSLVTFGTATYGALVSAHDYLRDVNSSRFSDEALQDGDELEVLEASATPITTAVLEQEANMCTSQTIIFLITDGEPFTLLNGNNINSAPREICNNPLIGELGFTCPTIPAGENNVALNDDLLVSHTRNSILPLVTAMREGYEVSVRDDGTATMTEDNRNRIDTFVFGFAIGGNNADRQNLILNEIANAGSTIMVNGVETPRPVFESPTPEILRTNLTEAIAEVVPLVTSGSGVSISTSPGTGGGAIVSSSFNPSIASQVQGSTEQVSWVGTVPSFFLDEFGFLRNDGGGDAQNPGNDALDDFATDQVFELFFDADQQQTFVQFLTITDPDTIGTDAFIADRDDPNTNITNDGPPIPFAEANLTPIWEASEELGSYPIPAIYGNENRPYPEVAEGNTIGYRHIITSLPNAGGSINQIDFVPDLITEDNFGLFAVETQEEARNVIRFIRGQEEIEDFRSRTIDGEKFLLGDIVHSTTAIVDIPSEDFGSRFGDASYIEFQTAHQFRRRMVYVGGNDGMLHAFNGGFFDTAETSFELRADQLSTIGECSINCNDNTEYQLGAEVWAYVPGNLIPHLQFLTDADYDSSVHVAYVDGPVNIFDVQIFDPDDTHVNGWGTIAVVGFRLGGGDFTVDPNADGDLSDAVTTQSAYVVLDVTDPTVAPTVLAEITAPNQGFATSNTQILRNEGQWFLAFGSGPTNILDFTAVTDDETGELQEPTFFSVNLNDVVDNLDNGAPTAVNATSVITGVNGFVGELTTVDWNSDTIDDAVYFGTNIGNATNPSGDMYRFVADQDIAGDGVVRSLLDVGQPFFSAPVAAIESGQNWVLFGSGRYLSNADILTDLTPDEIGALNPTQNAFYGVIEDTENFPTRQLSELVNVTDVQVNAATGVINPVPSGVPAEVNTSEALSNFIVDDTNSFRGWFSNFEASPLPSDRTTAAPVVISEQVIYATFSPPLPSQICAPVFGESFLNVGNITNGLPSAIASLGVDDLGNIIDSQQIGESAITSINVVIVENAETGQAEPSVIISDQNSGITNQAIGSLPSDSGRRSWIELESQ